MPWSSTEPTEFIAALEKEGESGVRAALAREDKWITLEGRSKIAEEWLRAKESAIRDAREAETLSIAKQANRYALYATIIAVIGTIISVKSEIHALILILLNP